MAESIQEFTLANGMTRIVMPRGGATDAALVTYADVSATVPEE
jgi:hypothetical protein